MGNNIERARGRKYRNVSYILTVQSAVAKTNKTHINKHPSTPTAPDKKHQKETPDAARFQADFPCS